MKPEANAVLLTALTKSFNDKPKQVCDSHTKPKQDDGKAEWVRFKRECVLLRGSVTKKGGAK